MQTATAGATAMPAKSTAARTDIWKVPFAEITILDGFNIRKDYGDIQSLADSIRENGVKVPMRGYKKNGQYFVVDGHRRYQACKILADEGTNIIIPFILEHKGYSEEQRVVDMFITNDGKNLSPLEQAEGVKRLINYGYTQRDISKMLGRSESYIGKLNLLHQSPKKFLNLIEENLISATFALKMIGENRVQEVIDQYENASPESGDVEEEGGFFEHEEDKEAKAAARKKLTAKNFQGVNSWKNFKTFIKKAQVDVERENRGVYEVLVKLVNNELSMEDIEAMFSQKA